MSGYRLPSGGRVDRGKKLGFRWDRRPLAGCEGDSLASALLASGVKVFGRSFKYHRPRGVFAAGCEEPGAYVTVGRGARAVVNCKAPSVELREGMEAFGQNAWPSVRFDLGASAGMLSRFLPAGFYYKTFMGPVRGTRYWMLCERLIRSAAGMGRASREADPDAYDRGNMFCDLLVVGSGPAGLAAAELAAEAGLDVVLVEQDFDFGGGLLSETAPVERRTPAEWIKERMLALAGRARVLRRTTAFGLYDDGVAGLHQRLEPERDGFRGRFWVVRAGRVLLATGATERGFAFPDNDRPGVMLASAARSYANRFAVSAGRRTVLATSNDSAYAVARDLAAAGVETVLLDARERSEADAGGARVMRGWKPCGIRGWGRWREVEIVAGSGRQRLPFDALAVSGGWNPTVHLMSQRGLRPVWNAELAAFVPPEATPGMAVAGAARGVWTTAACVESGRSEAARLVGEMGGRAPDLVAPPAGGWNQPILPLYEVARPGDAGGRSFVDLQNDVTAADVRLSLREGYDSPELLKRYTTLGMSPDQGKTSNVVALGILAEAAGATVDACGTTTFRPPYEPVDIGALAGRARGRHFRPVRRTPAHAFHYRSGAPMIDAGLWRRPWYYPAMGEGVDEAHVREAETVRRAVGITDVSTLGKIAVQGPDAGRLLDCIYVNVFSNLPVGRARYGVMLRDDGMVLDDGTAWRLGEHEYFVTTTTSQEDAVTRWLERLLATRLAELRVHVTSVTDQWGGVAVAGPRAREVLAGFVPGFDLSDGRFPFMAVREGRFALAEGEVDCRLARISFSGEQGFEIFVGADHTEAVTETLTEAVRAAGGCPYGLEAMGTLRIEKGHVAGAELDGRVTLRDIGLERMASSSKHHVGKVLSRRPELNDPQRPKLAAILPVESAGRFKGGAILCEPDRERGRGVGWVSSVTHSPALGHWMGIGFVAGGAEAWEGREVTVAEPESGRSVRARVVSPQVYDPAGEKMRG